MPVQPATEPAFNGYVVRAWKVYPTGISFGYPQDYTFGFELPVGGPIGDVTEGQWDVVVQEILDDLIAGGYTAFAEKRYTSMAEITPTP